MVLLQHGLLSSSADWVVNNSTQSLAFALADNGYDVWMGNSRGNTYSREHVSLTTADTEYWNFTFDEMGKYDLPAIVDYILSETYETSLHYIGHSQGTTQAFIELGRNDELNKKIKTFVALAPVTTVGHIQTPLANIVAPAITTMYSWLGGNEILPSNWLMKFLAKTMCELPWTGPLCANVIFLLQGFDQSNLNQTRIPVYMAHTPAGASVKDVVHFSQFVSSGKFQAFDYGWSNDHHYGQSKPPEYTPENIMTPVALFTGTNDWLADPEDSYGLRDKLQNLIFEKDIVGWNHLDFLWGIDSGEVLFPDLLKVLGRNVN